MRRFLLFTTLALAACSNNNPAAPTQPRNTPDAAPTRIMNLFGDLQFGGVQLGQSVTGKFTVQNTGTADLHVSNMTAPSSGVAVLLIDNQTFSVNPGALHDVYVRFTPQAQATYQGILTVVSDATTSISTGVGYSGAGVLDGLPIYSMSGAGDFAFSLPSYVAKVRVQGTTTAACQNFIVQNGPRSIVNVILGTCRVADERAHDGTYLIQNGTAMQVVASGINWTITEVR